MDPRRAGRRANAAVGQWAAAVDDQTGEVARRSAGLLVVAVRLLRLPTLALLIVPWPAILILLGVAALSAGWVRWTALVVGVGAAAVSAALGWRRWRILRAVDDEQKLGTELGIAVALSDDVDSARDALGQLAGSAGGGFGLFGRLRAIWSGLGVGSDILTDATDLPRAKWFFPPKLGSTLTVFFVNLWMVLVVFVACPILVIAAVAHA